ncbi:MAG: HD domain-containing phosphohydrolase [Dehalococcoidia bacterium]
MGKQSARKVYVLYAICTILLVLLVSVLTDVFRLETLRRQSERDAAQTVSDVLSRELESAGPELSDDEIASFMALADDLTGTALPAVRVWLPSGDLVASTDRGDELLLNPQALGEAASGEDAVFKEQPTGGGAVLVSYAPTTTGMILEVQQDYAPVGESVEQSRLLFLLLSVAGGVGLLVLLPGILWAAGRGLNTEYSRLLYLYRTGQSIRSTLDVSDVLSQLARDASTFAHADVGLTALVEEDGKDLILKASFEREGDTISQHHRKVEEWFLRRCAATGETVLARQDRLPYRNLIGHEPPSHGPSFIVAVPIPGHSSTIGVVSLIRRKALGKFGSQEVHVIEEMASQAAMTVEQAVLFGKMRNYATEVELSYDTTLKVLMAALDAKDSATEGHSERVAKLTVVMAKEMGIPKERLVDIERGALLHDVGKIGVPDAVLQKPEALNELEWEAMEKHPLLAGLMVSKVEFLEGALPILLYHHEHYDGTGYPFGLEGDAIPLEARIFTIVDSYDAMTSDRPYRKAMRTEEALAEIQRNAGIQFDPQAVEAFARVVARMQPAEKKKAA